MIAHHDAPQTGLLFDQTPAAPRLGTQPGAHRPSAKRSLPQWWIGLAAPLGTLLTVLTGRRAPARAGLTLGTLGTALVADVWRSPTVQGANDNLSGVAALVALAEMLAAERRSGPARAARLVRRRGDAAGRHPRVRRPPRRRAWTRSARSS